MAQVSQEWLQERYTDLEDSLRSDGWRLVILPALNERRRNIANKLARGRRLPEMEIRELQAQFTMLELIVTDPVEFFKTTYEEAADREFTAL